MAEALCAGNAVKLILGLATGSAYQQILCKTSDTFTGPFDPNALTIATECAEDSIIDARDSLQNGTEVFYRAYDWVGGSWIDQGQSFFATPSTTYIPDTLDVQELVRDRVQLGVTAAIVQGRLTPASGSVKVTTAPFSLAENTTFPTVSVHYEQGSPEVRGIGDDINDFLDPTGTEWISTEGWLGRTALNITAVSQNPDERIQLRKVVRQIIQVNMEVFADAGMILPEFSQTDTEEFTENNVPLYLTNGTFSCVAPAWVRDPTGLIADVTLNPGVLVPPVMTIVDFEGAESI